MVGPSKKASMRNEVTLVWGSLRLAPISEGSTNRQKEIQYLEEETPRQHPNIDIKALHLHNMANLQIASGSISLIAAG